MSRHPTQRRKRNPFGVNVCSACDEIRVTMGEHIHGGVRYCRDCLKDTLSWFQMAEAGRVIAMQLFDALEQHPTVAASLERLSGMPEDQRKAIAMGEARRRAMLSQ